MPNILQPVAAAIGLISLFLALPQALGGQVPPLHPPLMERGSGGEARPLVVATDGTGDFTTVQAAVDAVSAGNSHPVTIRIKPGIYHERITIPRNKPHIAFV